MNYLLQIQNLFQNYYTEDFIYRPFVKSDTFPLFDATKNPEFNRYLLWNAPKDIAELTEQTEMLLREQLMNKHLLISACDLISGEWAGFIKLTPFEDGIELSLWMHPNYWQNKNYFQIVYGILHLFFTKLSLPFIYVKTHIDNIKMQKIMKGYHFQHCRQTYLTHQNQQQLLFDIYRLEKNIWCENLDKFYSLNYF